MSSSNENTLSSHALDTETGRPASNLQLALQKQISEDKWETLATRSTNSDGRVTSQDLPKVGPGVYRILFNVQKYYEEKEPNKKHFYPVVPVIFQIPESEGSQHYHIPLLLSPYGYSTYRGS